MLESWQTAGFGLYVHWPFCESKCPYCDFNSHVQKTVDTDAYLAAYLASLDHAFDLTGPRTLRSIFFGGGTPSLMDPRVTEAIIQRATQHWPASNDIEITLEANPSSVEADRFRAFRTAGVNRVSLGVQALNDRDLRKLGRLHSVDDAKRAIALAQDTFDRMSFDLIYARQDQTLSVWEQELSEALRLGAEHLSLYQLTIEPGTAFGDRFKAGKLRGLPSDDTGADLYEMTQDLCNAAGLPAYEVSNHAVPGKESRHNLIYWSGGDWAGIGPGAHGRLTVDGQRIATETERMPQAWINEVSTQKQPCQVSILDGADVVSEHIMMCLRVTNGINLDLISDHVAPSTLNHLESDGLIRMSNNRLACTQEGWMVLNQIVLALLPDR